MDNSTYPQLVCGTERIKWAVGMTNLERLCATGWDVDRYGCWIWRGERFGKRAKFASLYGTRNTSRIVWEEMHGPIDEGLVVRHKCDNGSCVNPAHLELGSTEDNRNDMRQRGRRPSFSLAKAERIRQIHKTDRIPADALARRFKVDVVMIEDVLERRGEYRDEVPAVAKYGWSVWSKNA
jgi:hypothetical protein